MMYGFLPGIGRSLALPARRSFRTANAERRAAGGVLHGFSGKTKRRAVRAPTEVGCRTRLRREKGASKATRKGNSSWFRSEGSEFPLRAFDRIAEGRYNPHSLVGAARDHRFPGRLPFDTFLFFDFSTVMLSWTYLIVAGLFEMGWPLGFKLANAAEGRMSWLWIGFSVLSMVASGYFLFQAQKNDSDRHGLHRLDRDRRRRHGGDRDDLLRRQHVDAADLLPLHDPRRRHRPEARALSAHDAPHQTAPERHALGGFSISAAATSRLRSFRRRFRTRKPAESSGSL